mmetsp:Transcript_21056/g.62846  ORF Transcript_21056/g.62846 Transcript_21056/m.62846 type:complete len:275 (+) Transcript_21056:271-1095(+)
MPAPAAAPEARPARELLGVIVELSPAAAASSSDASFARVVEAAAAMGRSHVMCNPRAGAEFCCIAALPGATRECEGGGYGTSTRLAATLREAAEAAAGDRDSKPPALAAALGRFLCRARAHAADAGEGNVARARVVVLKAADDDASQYHAIMNCVFAARRRSVLIDACSLGPRPSSLMKQAAHLTRGAFVHVPPVHIDRLTAVSLSALSADSSVRARVSLPVLEDADMRVACVCCAPPKILDRGYVCTTCLSVFCDADATCPCSRHVLRAMDVG